AKVTRRLAAQIVARAGCRETGARASDPLGGVHVYPEIAAKIVGQLPCLLVSSGVGGMVDDGHEIHPFEVEPYPRVVGVLKPNFRDPVWAPCLASRTHSLGEGDIGCGIG